VSAILTDTGRMVEWDKYSAYGVPSGLPAGDTDSDGDWDATDSGAITGAYDVRKDTELDGDVDTRDVLHANSITGTYQTLGRGVLSSTAVNNRRGYAGYEHDPTFEGAPTSGRHLYHVRHRVYDAGVGRWTRRDPLGYLDGMSLYAYVQGLAVVAVDPTGLIDAKKHCPKQTNGNAACKICCQVNAKDASDAITCFNECNKSFPIVRTPPPPPPPPPPAPPPVRNWPAYPLCGEPCYKASSSLECHKCCSDNCGLTSNEGQACLNWCDKYSAPLTFESQPLF